MKEITQEELVERLVSGEAIRIVDIREADAYVEWHIHGAENFPVYNAIHRGEEGAVAERLEGVPADRPVVAVCNRGNSSRVAAHLLEGMGRDAASLVGGMQAWTRAWTECEVPSGIDGVRVLQIRRNGKGCLSYLVVCGNDAAVIDACVDVDAYVSIAAREKVKITHVMETHVHADHVSRARALRDRTGARLFIPKNQRVQFDYVALNDGETLTVGPATFTVIATPGHTQESVCYRLGDALLFTGDTIFTDSLGRPDLEKGDAGAKDGAKALFDSVHGKLVGLDGGLVICPGHTADPIGFDGRPITATLTDVLSRVSLIKLDKDKFVTRIVESLGQKPPNFDRVLAVNEGHMDLGFLDPIELEAGPNRCAISG